MKALATLALLLSLPGSHITLPPRAPVGRIQQHTARRGGRWYLAENGHAVFCYGPVMLVPNAQNGLQRVATFCAGEKAMVPLKD